MNRQDDRSWTWVKVLALALPLTFGALPAGVTADDALTRHGGSDCAIDIGSAARASIVVRPYRPTRAYDIDAEGRPVPVELTSVTGAAAPQAVLSYPYPQRHPGAPSGFAQLVTRSFVYDDALYALERIMAGDHATARAVLSTIRTLQRHDGAIGFSFDVARDGFYNAGYVRAGVVAFAVYALAKYQLETADPDLVEAALSGGQWLLGQRDPELGLIRAGYGRWTRDGFDPTFPADFVVTEHQIDAFFAFLALAKLDPHGPWLSAAARLREAILGVLWMTKEQRFAQGWSRELGLDTGSALDSSGTWGALFLHGIGHRGAALRALAWVDRRHSIELDGWSGLRPFAGEQPRTWFVEGSVAYAIAVHRLGQSSGADILHARGAVLLGEIDALACRGGLPLVYSPRWVEDFPLTPAAAPTLWYLFALAETREGLPPFLWSESLATEVSSLRP